MNNLLKNNFALTDTGVRDLKKSIFSCTLSYFITMLPAIFLMFIFDNFILKNIENKESYLLLSIIILIVMYAALNYEYNSTYNATFRESENMRINLGRRFAKLPISYFSKNDLTDLSQTIMEDVAAIEHAISHAIAKAISFIIFFMVISFMLIMGNIKLGLLVIFPIVLNFIFLFLSKKFQVTNHGKYYKKLRENADNFQEAIELQQEIKSMGLDKEIKDQLYKKIEESEKIHIRSEFTFAISLNLAGIVLYVSLAGVIYLGTYLYLAKEITILYFIGYLLAAMKLKDLADVMSFNVAELFSLVSPVKRIQEIYNTPVQDGEKIELRNYDIELENVGFSYNDETEILKNVSFVAKQNEVTALVGKSGCGKTTLLRLISRLYDYDKGSIKIGDIDIKNIDTNSLFMNISIVFQEVVLFNTSVLENIRIGNLSATDEEVKEAANLANCSDFIEKLPQGYDTVIGENGASLSGGERQRISIARAFLKKSKIIILDEISSSLDVENEKKIQESLNLLTKDKTVIIISHRLKSIEGVDKIVVLNEGEVEAIGSHNELLHKSTTYNSLIDNSKKTEQFIY